MDIYITGVVVQNNKNLSVRIQLPVLPEEIKYKSSAKMAEYEIMDLGSVAVPAGTELTEYSWEGILPGEKRKNAPWVRSWTDPNTIQSLFKNWKDNGTKLQLVITETPFNDYVYLRELEVNPSGAFGDFPYSIAFVTARDIVVAFTQAEKPVTRPVAPTPAVRSYTVVSGDCLWNIARKYYNSGAQYGRIYDANKDVIESTAKRHGKSSSQNGHWIYPGTVLNIP